MFATTMKFLVAASLFAGVAKVDAVVGDDFCTDAYNLALGGTATQDRDTHGLAASIAVDGNKDAAQHSLAGLRPDQGTWWRVDLGVSTTIKTIRIHKGTNGHPLRDFRIEIYDTDYMDPSLSWLENHDQQSAVYWEGVTNDLCDDTEFVIPDNGVVGRFVQIVSAKSTQLALSEVEVFGASCEDPNLTALTCSNELHIEAAPEHCGCYAASWGDPHILTFDWLEYDAHAKGTAIYLQSQTSLFEIQARLDEFSFGLPGSPATVGGIAVKGETEADPTIQVSINPNGVNTMSTQGSSTPGWFQQCPVEIHVDGILQAFGNYSTAEGTAAPHINVFDVPGEPASILELNFPGLIRVTFKVHKYGDCFFEVTFELENCDCEHHHLELNGLLGTPDGDASNDWTNRGMEKIPLPTGTYDLYCEPAFLYTRDNWILKCDESARSIMTYYDSFAAHCIDEEPYDSAIELIFQEVDPVIQAICGDDPACTMDGVNVGEDAAEDSMATDGSHIDPFVICADGEIKVELDFVSDLWASWDNSIKLIHSATEEHIWDVGAICDDTLHHFETCLDPSECYVLMFVDAWGDGFMEGYNLTWTVNGTVEYDDHDFGTGFISQVGHCPEPDEVVCEDGQFKVELTFNSDMWSGGTTDENAYVLASVTTNALVWYEPEIDSNVQYHKEECLNWDECYQFYFADSFGDGFDSGHHLTWVVDGTLLFNETEFGHGYESFVGTCSTPAPTPDPTCEPTPAPTPYPTTPDPTPAPTPYPTTADPTPYPTTADPTPYPTTPDPTPAPTPYPTTADPTPYPTTADPTPQPTPAPQLINSVDNPVRNEDGSCIEKMGIMGSEFGGECNHDGVGIVSAFPPIDKLNPPEFSFGALEDVFYNIDVGGPDEDLIVRFYAQNPFEATMDMYVQFEQPVVGGVGHPRETVCEGTPDVGICEATDESSKGAFEAVCIDAPGAHPYALVTVYFVNHAVDPFFGFDENATVDQCCHADGLDANGNEIVEYTFFITCTCPDDVTPARALRG